MQCLLPRQGLSGVRWGITVNNNSSNPGTSTTITISDAASVTGTDGTALNLTSTTGVSATVNNAGSITGSVTFAAGDDTFNHLKSSTPVVGGVLQIVDGTIDFGAGNDTFRNRSVLAGFAGALPTFTGLETFVNAGEIRLMNGVAGDVFNIGHNFVGETGSQVSIDVSAGSADELRIVGNATGSTGVMINVVTPLTRSVRAVNVQGNAAETSFVLANPEVGLFRYALSYEDLLAEDNFFLTQTGASSKAKELSAISPAIQEIFQRAIPRYQERSDSRQTLSEGEGDVDVWFVGIYDQMNIDSKDGDVDIDTHAALFGIEKPVGDWNVGGYLGVQSGDAELEDNGKVDVDGFSVDAYINRVEADWYADLAVEWQQSEVDYDGGNVVGEDEKDGHVYGFALEGGKDVWSYDAQTVSVFGRYAYGRADIDDMNLNGIEVKFDTTTTSRGEAGIRWTHTEEKSTGYGLKLSLEGAVVNEFDGDNEASFGSFDVDHDSSGTWGRIGGSASLQVTEDSAAYVRVNGLVGGDRSGSSISLGYRKRF